MKPYLFLVLSLLFLLSSCVSPTGTNVSPLPTDSPLSPTPIVPTYVAPVPPTETPMPPTPQPGPSPSTVTLQRGVNMGNMLEAPNEGEWGLYVQEEYFDLIKEAGFDFVRLPVRWNTHAQEEWPYTIDTAFFARVDEIVGWSLGRNLAVIVDFHHYEELAWDP